MKTYVKLHFLCVYVCMVHCMDYAITIKVHNALARIIIESLR